MSKSLDLLFSPFVILPLFFILIGLLLFFVLRQKRDSDLRHALDLSLYEVSFPRSQKEEKPFKELVSKMEQFYMGMLNLGSYFSLEIVSPSTENEINFYVAVPRDKISVFQNQVRAVFPTAEIREEKADYNIFKYGAPNAGATLKLKTSDVLPIKTYEELETSPLEVVVNTFSDLERDKEGASLQIIIDPQETNFKKSVQKSINLINSGEPVKSALKGGESLQHSFLKVATGGTIHSNKDGVSALSSMEREANTEILSFLNKKIAKPIMRANIRLVVSSQTTERSQSILNQVKSAFSQYSSVMGNAFVANDLKGSVLKNFFHNFSFRLFNEKESLHLNTEELTSIFHFPSYGLSAPKVKLSKTRNTEPPVSLQQKGVVLGKNFFRGKETDIHFSEDDRRRHFYTIGQTGTGKSALLKNMVLQDIKAGHGVCFIDPHGSDLEDVLGQIPEERWEDVVYFNPADTRRPFGLNMLEYDKKNPEQKTFIVNELLEIFDKLYDMSVAGGPMFEQYFRNATLLVMEDPESGNTLLEISRVLTDEDYRELKLSKSNNPVVNNFWKETAGKAGGEAALANIVPYITSKFDTFLSNEIMRPILAQENTSLNFREIMDDGKILLINLSKGRLGELNANLLGMLLVGKIFMAAMSRVDIPESTRKDFYFYIDEFQNITTNSIAMILSEARKYRLDLTIAHQFIGQLDEEIKKAVFGNVGSLAVFRVGEEDAEFLAKMFEPVFEREDLTNIPNYNAYLKLLVGGESTKPFNIQTIPPEETSSQVASKVKELSAIKYGRPASEVESEIRQKYLKTHQQDEGEEDLGK